MDSLFRFRFLQYLWGIETYVTSMFREMALKCFYSTYEELKPVVSWAASLRSSRFYSTYEELKQSMY